MNDTNNESAESSLKLLKDIKGLQLDLLIQERNMGQNIIEAMGYTSKEFAKDLFKVLGDIKELQQGLLNQQRNTNYLIFILVVDVVTRFWGWR